jgi:hypothetical protein
MQKIALLLLVSLVVTGCSNRYAGFKPPKFISFEEEIVRIMEELPCVWTHGKADSQSVEQYDFGCHAGEWGSVSLYLDRKNDAPESVQRVRLLWKEKNPKYAIGANEEEVAREFVEFVARNYAPQLELVRTVFFDTKHDNFNTTQLHFDYSYVKSTMYGLHRLEITEKKSLKRKK